MSTADGSIICEYTLSQDEAVPTLRRIIRRRPTLQLGKVAGVALAAVGVAKLVLADVPVIEGATFIYAGLVLFGITEILTFRAAKVSFKRTSLGQPHIVAFDHAGFEVSGTANYHREWREVRGVREYHSTYVIGSGMNRWLIVPRRSFRQPEDEDRFRGLVTLTASAHLSREAA